MCGSIQATDRLMKELRDVYRSDSFKRGKYMLSRKCIQLAQGKCKLSKC